MLQTFRSFFKSKIGIVFTLVFLAVIAIAFASADVANTGTFGGVTGGDRVAVVGNTKLSTSELTTNMNNALSQVRQNDPTVTMEAFLARDGLEEVLSQMLSRTAIAEFGKEYGLRAGKRLIDSEIRQFDAFRGASGTFDETAFRAALRQRGLTESAVRDDLAMGLIARQIVTPISLPAFLPKSLAVQYSQLLREERSGSIGLLPSAAFAPKVDPTAAQLQAYYTANRTDYIRPERRVIRYGIFGDSALGTLPAPTQAQIAARYIRDKANYAAQESRSYTQLVLPTQAAAQAVAAEVAGGKSLAQAAQEKGLATTTIGPVTRAALAASTSAAVAQAGFAASRGAMTSPVQGGLGWYLLRLDTITNRPARTVAQVSSEISTALAAEQRTEALNDMTARIEQELDSGSGLSEVASELKLTLQTTRPITAAGQVYGSAEPAPAVLGPVLAVAFEMEEGAPQLAVLEAGTQFMVYDVSDITRSATAPLAEIRNDVVTAWRLSEGQKAANAAAGRVMERLSKGTTMAAALREESVPLPAPDAVKLNRDQIASQGQVPPVLALLFSMAEGTAKRLEAPSLRGWFVVQLADITTPELDPNDPMVLQTQSELARIVGDEYAEQFVNAVETMTGVERNQVAIDAVAAQLGGTAN